MTEPNKPARQEIDSFFRRPCTVASATDCTGLVQSPPDGEEEAASLMDIYDIPYMEKPR